MKILTRFIYLLLMFVLACQEKQVQSKKEILQSEIVTSDSLTSTTREEVIETNSIRPQTYYVKVKTGAEYCAEPNGEIVGEIPLNTLVTVIEHTGVFVQNDSLKGEWFGIQKDQDTVYMINTLLSSSYQYADIELYLATTYHSWEQNDYKQLGAFVNLSERYQYESELEKLIPTERLGQDNFLLTEADKSSFLNGLGISEANQLFIYNFALDSIYTYQVKDLPLMATVEWYHKGDKDVEAMNYQLGLKLPDDYLGNQHGANSLNLVYIGSKNIFQTGHVKPMIWERISQEALPEQFNFDLLPKNLMKLLTGSDHVFAFSTDQLDFYAQRLQREVHGKVRIDAYYFMAFDADKQIVFHERVPYRNGSWPTTLTIKGEKKQDTIQWQWVGKLFKGKPTMIYSLAQEGYACRPVTFLDPAEPPIRILCDNRN
ncbi:MAG: hypothetical protein ACPGJS_15445 [Flammeovirgaceae bacterium]